MTNHSSEDTFLRVNPSKGLMISVFKTSPKAVNVIFTGLGTMTIVLGMSTDISEIYAYNLPTVSHSGELRHLHLLSTTKKFWEKTNTEP